MSAVTKDFAESFEGLYSKAGLKKWRFKGKKLAVQGQSILGTFYEEECYLILETNKEHRVSLERVAHVWIGSNVTPEVEMGVLELVSGINQYVRNVVCITKQKQDEETRDFLNLFPKGIKYLHGAYEKYLHFQNGKFCKRLYQVKGKRNIKIRQVPLHSDSLNHGDAFVLEDEWSMYIWNGKNSSKVERIKAIEVAQWIRDDLCYGKAEIFIADAGVDKTTEKSFFKVLGSQSTVKRAGIDDSKENIESFSSKMLRGNNEAVIFRLTENHGEIHAVLMAYDGLYRDTLKSSDCYIVHDGKIVYVWCGHKADEFVKKKALVATQIFLMEKGLDDDHLPIVLMLETYETSDFTKLFDKWPIKTVSVEGGKVTIRELSRQQSHDASGRKYFKDDMIDDANGTIKIWRIAGFDKIEWPTNSYGLFYENESYIILYTNSSTQDSIIYIWQGAKCPEDEQEHAMYYAQLLDDSLFRGRTTQVHVVYGDESNHFLSLFKGKYTVLQDEKDSSKQKQFFQISGTNGLNTKTVQIQPMSSQLDSEDIFVLKLKDKAMVWEGVYTNDFQKNIGELVADQLSPDGDLLIFQEGFEPREFWIALGGKTEYNLDSKKMKEYLEPRLYHCSDRTGEFKVKEICPFDQDDLNQDDVMILDTNEEIYIWIGNGANTNEKNKAWDYVKDYLDTCDTTRKFEDTNVMQVKQCQEPNCFANLFPSWDDEKARGHMPYEVYKNLILQENKESRQKEAAKPTLRQSQGFRGEQRVLRRSISATDELKEKSYLSRFNNHYGYME